jgi:hypothetical protein
MNVQSLLPGKFFFRQSEHGGFDVLYRSFGHAVTLYHCWTSSEHNARNMVADWNANILGGDETSANRAERRLEETARIIAANRRRPGR